MITQWWGIPAAGERGIWTALVEPIRSRRIRFHLLRKSHYAASGASAVLRRGEHGETVMEAIKTYGIKFELVEIPEGEFPAEPTIDGCWEGGGNGDAGDLRDFLQAIVDCAAQMGIAPTTQPDLGRELAATRNHLEDMRRLALKGSGYRKAQ